MFAGGRQTAGAQAHWHKHASGHASAGCRSLFGERTHETHRHLGEGVVLLDLRRHPGVAQHHDVLALAEGVLVDHAGDEEHLRVVACSRWWSNAELEAEVDCSHSQGHSLSQDRLARPFNDDDRGKAHAATGACNDVGTHRGPGRRKNRHSSTWAGPPRTLAPCSAPGSCTGGPALCRRSRCTPRTPCLQLAQHMPEAGAAELFRKPRLRRLKGATTMALEQKRDEAKPLGAVARQSAASHRLARDRKCPKKRGKNCC